MSLKPRASAHPSNMMQTEVPEREHLRFSTYKNKSTSHCFPHLQNSLKFTEHVEPPSLENHDDPKSPCFPASPVYTLRARPHDKQLSPHCIPPTCRGVQGINDRLRARRRAAISMSILLHVLIVSLIQAGSKYWRSHSDCFLQTRAIKKSER